MKVAGYVRVSSQEQVDNTSLESQRAQIQAYATLKAVELVGIFQDAGISGGKPIAQRPEGARLVDTVNRGEVQAVIITKLDRGFRNTIDCLQTIEQWKARGVGLHVIDMGGNSVDTATSAGEFMISVLAAAAQMERRRIAERCNEGRKARQAEGKRIGEIPFGYDLDADTNRLVANEAEQKVIADIHRLDAEGHSYRSIAQNLNDRGITTKKCGKWTAMQVSRVLKRAA